VTDRHVAYTVLLEREIREDDAEAIVSAISMVKGVREVVPVVADVGMYFAVSAARHDLMMDLLKFVQEWRKKKGDG